MKKPDNLEEFSSQVVALQKWAVNASSDPAPSTDVDVRRVALGLAAISQLIRRRTDELKDLGDLDGVTGEGIKAAADLVEALLTGRKHPVFDHIRGVRSSAGRPPPTNQEWISRACIVGTVQAYSKAACVGESEAIRVILKNFTSIDFALTDGMVRSWQKQFNNRRGEIGPTAAENSITQLANSLPSEIPLPDRILIAGGRYVQGFRACQPSNSLGRNLPFLPKQLVLPSWTTTASRSRRRLSDEGPGI